MRLVLLFFLFSSTVWSAEIPKCMSDFMKTESLDSILKCEKLDKKEISKLLRPEEGPFFEKFEEAYQEIDVACALNDEDKYKKPCESLLNQIQDIHYTTFEQVADPLENLTQDVQDIEDFIKGKKEPVLGEKKKTPQKAIFNLPKGHPLSKGEVAPIAAKDIKLELLIGCMKYLNSPDGLLGGMLKSMEPYLQSVLISKELDAETRGLAFCTLKSLYENPLDMDKHMWLMMNMPMDADTSCEEK